MSEFRKNKYPKIIMDTENNWPSAESLIKRITSEEWGDILHHTHAANDLASEDGDAGGFNDELKLLKMEFESIKEAIKKLAESTNTNVGDLSSPEIVKVDTVQNTIDAISESPNGSIVKITASIDAETQAVKVEGKTITLNLNGNTVKSSNSNSTGLIVKDGKMIIDGQGIIVSNDPYKAGHTSGAIVVQDGGELIINSGKLKAVISENPTDLGQFGIAAYGKSNININGGEIETGWYCCTFNGSTTNPDSTLTINDGTLRSVADFALYLPIGNLVINGGTISGAAGGISCNRGKVIINGGTVECSGGGNTGDWSDGTGGQVNAAINLNGKYGAVDCEINGGIIKSAGNNFLIVSGNTYPVAIKITGGYFSSKPNEEWIVDGYVCSETKNKDGYYVVTAAG